MRPLSATPPHGRWVSRPATERPRGLLLREQRLEGWADSSGHSDTELSSKPANTSTGVCHPSVLRGRPLSSSATLSRSAWECNDRSVPFGKYCRSNPLVFSLLPRCHGECGSQKYTSIPVATEKSACRAISFP